MQVTELRDQNVGSDQGFVFEGMGKAGRDELMVEVFTTEKLLEDLSIYWKELEKRADGKICMSYDWAYNWWIHYGKNKQRSLFIITIWDGTKLVGLAPFYKGYSQFGSITLERRLRLIGSGGSPNEQLGYLEDNRIGNSLDLVVDRSYRDSVADFLADEIITYRFLGTDELKFSRADDNSFIMNYLYPRLQDRFPNMRLKHSDTYPYIDLNRYSLEGKSGIKQKTDVGVTSSQIPVDKGIEYTVENISSNWEKINKAVDKIIEFYRKDQHSILQVFYDARLKKFLRDTFKNAFKDGRLWVKQAKNSDGEICALRTALFYNGRYFNSECSFEQSCSSHNNPCNILLAELVNDGVEREARTIELLKGEEEKYDFSFEKFKTWRVSIPLGERDSNIPLLLNRVGAVLYKFFKKRSRPAAIANQQEGLLRIIAGYIRFRWSRVSWKLNHLK